jgi:hypothetical protein
MLMGKEKLIPIFAMVVLLIGIFSSVYVHATQVNTDTIKIANETYIIEQIFSITKSRTVSTPDKVNFSGAALDDLIIKTGVDCLSCHKYKIIGSDNYEKTVTWENMQHGLLTKDGTVAFSDLAKAFRVKNVIKIEVVD